MPPPPPPFLAKRHFPGEGGGGVYFEAPRGRNFIPPPPLLYTPTPTRRVFSGVGGWGCIKFGSVKLVQNRTALVQDTLGRPSLQLTILGTFEVSDTLLQAFKGSTLNAAAKPALESPKPALKWAKPAPKRQNQH